MRTRRLAGRISGFVLLFCILVEAGTNAQADSPWFYHGDCTLDASSDVRAEAITSGFDVCIRARAGGDMAFVSGHSTENFAAAFLRGGASAHVFEYLSLFSEGHVHRRLPLGDDATESTDLGTDLLLARIGTPAIHGWSIASGRFTAPFGIGIADSSESYRYFSDEFHWRTYEYGHWLSWDDGKNFFIDLSYVGETAAGKRVRVDESVPENARDPDWGGSLRGGYDFSALEGSRLVGSLYAQNSGMRRTGLGFITVNSRGDANWIEFVRTRSTPDSKRDPFRQIIKFGYLSSWRGGGRWSVLIEEDRNYQRMSEFVYHISVLGYGELSLGVLLNRTLASPYRDRWHFTSGLEVSL
jgi:hypothetical protein